MWGRWESFFSSSSTAALRRRSSFISLSKSTPPFVFAGEVIVAYKIVAHNGDRGCKGCARLELWGRANWDMAWYLKTLKTPKDT